ncbi:TetR family transcriptional regulator [Nonomuraea sp. NPDC049684]|uniref:TetR family transcriptional regulator n=1 Tax=Nonomuraea sp. NPDC049684 TaxID=3364356 RepID=UPI0037B4E588
MPARRRGEIREEAILLAAMSLLSEVGYDQLTIEAIAERPAPARPRSIGDGRARPTWWRRPYGGTREHR